MYTRECSMGWCSVGGIARPDVGPSRGEELDEEESG